MFRQFFSFFRRRKPSNVSIPFNVSTQIADISTQAVSVLSYMGIAAAEYGHSFDIQALYDGCSDERFKTNSTIFHITCEVFSKKDLALAIKKTRRRSIVDDGAYVLGLSCSTEQIEHFRANGTFSEQIVEIINASTSEKIYLTKSYQDIANGLADFWRAAPLEICAEVVSNIHPAGKLIYPNNQPK